jgi:hypothetical protein
MGSLQCSITTVTACGHLPHCSAQSSVTAMWIAVFLSRFVMFRCPYADRHLLHPCRRHYSPLQPIVSAGKQASAAEIESSSMPSVGARGCGAGSILRAAQAIAKTRVPTAIKTSLFPAPVHSYLRYTRQDTSHRSIGSLQCSITTVTACGHFAPMCERIFSRARACLRKIQPRQREG